MNVNARRETEIPTRLRWYLHEQVAKIHDADQRIELVSSQLKVLFEAVQSRRTF